MSVFLELLARGAWRLSMCGAGIEWESWTKRSEGGDSHCLPPVCTEEQVNDMVVHLNLALQVAINHLANWRCSIYFYAISGIPAMA